MRFSPCFGVLFMLSLLSAGSADSVMAPRGETELLTPIEIRVWDGDFGKEILWLSFDGRSGPLAHRHFSSEPKAILFFLRSKGKYQLKWRRKRGAGTISGPEVVEEVRDIFVRDRDGFISVEVRGSVFTVIQRERTQYNPYYNPGHPYPSDYPARFESGKSVKWGN